MEIIKAGTTELTPEQAKKYYEEDLYICNYSGIWQPIYVEEKGKYRFRKVVDIKGYARRGRFFVHKGWQVNMVLGKKVLPEH